MITELQYASTRKNNIISYILSYLISYILKDPLLPAVSPFCEYLSSFLCSNDREWVVMERQTDHHHHHVSVNASLRCVYVFKSPTYEGEISSQLTSVTIKLTAKHLRQIIPASKVFTWS